MVELQKEIAEIRKRRGFCMEPIKIFSMLVEEVGEISSELKKTWSNNYNSFDNEKLSDELADAFVCLMALANQFNIDLEDSVRKKFILKDEGRNRKN